MKINDAQFGVVDVETTGLDPLTDRICEIALVRCSVGQGIFDRGGRLCDPEIPIPASASAIHHIVDDDVKPFGPLVPESFFSHDRGKSDFYVAHNAAFDSAFLPRSLGKFLCTMRLAQKLWPELESHSNQFLRYQLKLNPPVDRGSPMHRALPDAIVTATLLIHELKTVVDSLDIDVRENVSNNTVEELITWIERPMVLHTVRFGKYKGLLWNEVPKDYLRWVLKSMTDADRDTLHTANYYLN